MPKPNTNTWQLQDAKARFSEVFRQARSEGPQRVTRLGKDAVIVVAAEEFEKLKSRRGSRKSIVELFRNSPFARYGVTFERDPDREREVDL